VRISAKSSPTIDFKGKNFDLETGENLAGTVFDAVGHRLERFALQSAARVILSGLGSRVGKCLRLRRADKSAVEVWRSKLHDSASFGGLQTCGSVWACPICAAKISERRRLELVGAVARWRATGGDVLLITLTNPHHISDDLVELLMGQQRAMSRFNSTRAAVAFWHSIGCIGTVRAWEVTHGVNGWHPHFHILAFVRAGLDFFKVEESLLSIWVNACRLAGLPIPSGRGVDVRNGVEAASYASKWGIEHELTKGHIKKSRVAKGRTPFDLLRSVLYDDDKQAGSLFKIYAKAFKGLRQLVWSHGLKALLLVSEISDSELAASQEDSAFLLGQIDLEDWRLILKFDVRGEVLELARQGWEPVQRLISDLRRASLKALQNEVTS